MFGCFVGTSSGRHDIVNQQDSVILIGVSLSMGELVLSVQPFNVEFELMGSLSGSLSLLFLVRY
ncbi:hypothetical protein GCM10007876_37520 [Litoribrevibacter albus]|uniref:Uncharacterized protein n=1 Tax=Litoribrevibacter albus TaxID=1473156 RepID=A0AA37SEZ8_9GAMM|nr:hypothetical protein GCM10007876_37520 [Litoribrevibacter albus]